TGLRFPTQRVFAALLVQVGTALLQALVEGVSIERLELGRHRLGIGRCFRGEEFIEERLRRLLVNGRGQCKRGDEREDKGFHEVRIAQNYASNMAVAPHTLSPSI